MKNPPYGLETEDTPIVIGIRPDLPAEAELVEQTFMYNKLWEIENRDLSLEELKLRGAVKYHYDTAITFYWDTIRIVTFCLLRVKPDTYE